MKFQPWAILLPLILSGTLSAAENRPQLLDEKLNKLNLDVRRAKEATQADLEKARRALAIAAPKLPDVLQHLAEQFRDLERQTKEQAAQVAKDNKPQPEVADQLIKQQQNLNRKLTPIQENLRRDANTQNLANKEGRERARDDDDGVEMLRQPADAAEKALREAAEKPDAPGQQKQLEQAAEQQDKVADALELLAQHFKNMEKGDAEAVAKTREQLRKAEEELGIKKNMDQQFAQLERLMALANKPPAEALKDLEAELKNNPAMQEELRNIAEDAAEKAR
ncbi:MAG: hypothetical protein EXS22_08480, partial [Pedosphaera sp.]|nr:hypothetical protein [Pedosphaera sp.]